MQIQPVEVELHLEIRMSWPSMMLPATTKPKE
jgi:hypothetical protein